MDTYIYLIRPIREGFFDTPLPEEEEIMREHFDYLQKGAAAGTVLLAGPCLDNSFGVVILQAGSPGEAREFVRNDPSIKQRVMQTEFHPMRISLISQSWKNSPD